MTRTPASSPFSVHADGEVVLIERFESDFRFRMNMDAFPFDRQNLTIGLSLPRYAQQEAIVLTTEADRPFSGVEDALSVVDWRPVGLRFTNDLAIGWNARSYSRLNATVTIARYAERYHLRIFVPIIAVLAVSLFVLWSPGLKEQDGRRPDLLVAARPGRDQLHLRILVSRLDLPQYPCRRDDFARIPLRLVTVLMFEIALSVAIAHPSFRWRDQAADLRWHLRWAVPAMMLIICIGAAVRALPG